jgi:PAS domain S-box-containing protein
MLNFRDLPIRRKLTLIILLTTAAALFLLCGSMVIYETLRFRYSLVRELSTEAEIIADNSSAALAFADVTAARNTLEALRAQPGIVHACLFTPDGKIFAEYKSEDSKDDLPGLVMQPVGDHFEAGYVLLFRDVVFGDSDNVVGSLALRSDLREQNARLRTGGSIAAVALLSALLLALILSLKLQRVISAPVLELAEVAHDVSVRKDYSLRAGKRSNDEIGLLVEEFNLMLAQIESSDADLRASEERFRQLAESIREVFWLSDVEKEKVFYCSPGFEAVWGRTCEELRKSPWLWVDSIHSEDKARIRAAAITTQATGDYDEEYRIIRPDGTVRWIHDRAFPVRDAAGNVYRLAGIAEDVTKRKQAEEALQLAEARYRNIFENAIEGIFQTTPDGRYLAANPALARMLGYTSPEELMASIINLGEEMCVNQESREELKRQLHEKGEVREFENRLRRKDGSHIWVSLNVRVHRDESGAVLYYEGTASDVTERKRIGEALRQSEGQYRQLVELAHEGIWSIDAEANTTYANPHIAEMLGYTMEEMVGMSLFDFMDGSAIELCKQRLERRKQGIIEQHDFEFVRKDGARILTRMEAAPITNEAGVYCGAIACVSDITERKRAEEILQKTERLYRQAIIGAGAVPYVRDFKTRSYVFMGEAIEQLIGYGAHEVRGDIWEKIKQESIMMGEAAGLTVKEAAKLVEDGKIKTWQCDMRVITRDGRSRWVSDVSVQNLDESGRVIGSMGILQDITERKYAEKKLATFSSVASRLSAATTSEEAAANILETAAELIGWDCGFVHLYDAEADCTVPILTFDLIDGKRTEVRSPHSAKPSPMTRLIIEKGALLIDGQTRASLPFDFVPFGNKNRVSTSMMYVPIRRGAHVFGILSIQCYLPDAYDRDDLNLLQALADHCSGALQRIRATKELLETEAKYRKIFESATEGIFQTTPEGKYLRANPALARMFGYESPQEMAARVADIENQTYVLPERRKDLKRLLDSLGEIRGFEAERYRRDGSKFWMSINAHAVRGPGGTILYYEGTTRDVTARRHLEKQLIEISDREQSRMGQDLHDGLCQHLVRTAFAANLLEKDLGALDTAAQAKKVSRLVDEAITQARNLARGLYPVKLESEGLHSAMQELAANIRSSYQLDCEFHDEDSISIQDHAVATHLYRIAQEASANAARHAKAARIQIRLARDGDLIHLAVKDDGIGIAPNGDRGSGMGLHIMNYRAGMIGAQLKIESPPEGGTIVTCIFEHKNGMEKGQLFHDKRT